MIRIMLWEMRWRIAFLIVPAVVLFYVEHGFRPIEQLELDVFGFSPLDVGAALGYFASFAMIILLGGAISRDRREGYTRIFFSHPTSPLSYYALRWILAYAIAIAGAFLLLFFGQLVAWNGIRGGWAGMLLPLLTALIYGGLIAFFSTLLPRGDALVAILFFSPTVVSEVLFPLNRLAAPVRDMILLILPPNEALNQVYDGLRIGPAQWGAAVFAAGYGVLFLVMAGLILRMREWP
jgi:hypothetical protein